MKPLPKISLILLLFGMGAGTGWGATTFNDLAGTWNYAGFETGAEPRKDGNGNIIGLDLNLEVFRLEVSGTGGYQVTILETTIPEDTVGDQFSGNFLLGPEGDIWVSGEEDTTRFVVNEAGDLFMAVEGGNFLENPDLRLNLGARAPAAPTAGLVAGNWVYQAFYLREPYSTIETDREIPLVLNADSTGTIAFPGEGTFPFTTSFDTGRLVLTVGEGQSIRFALNAAGDVLARVQMMADPGNLEVRDFGMEIATRPPASVSLSDLVGLWVLHLFDSEVQWTLVDPQPGQGSNFRPFGNYRNGSYQQMRLLINSAGQFLGWTSDASPEGEGNPIRTPRTFQGSVDIDRETGRPRFTVTDDDGISYIIPHLNASKNFMALVSEEVPEENLGFGNTELLLAVKKDSTDRTLFSEVPGFRRGWRRLDWFGQFFTSQGEGPGWILHEEHGWIHVSGSRLSGFWVYFPGFDIDGGGPGSFLWTGSSLYPFFLRVNPGSTNPVNGFSWVYFAQVHYRQTGQLWFGDLSANPVTWVQETPVRPNN